MQRIIVRGMQCARCSLPIPHRYIPCSYDAKTIPEVFQSWMHGTASVDKMKFVVPIPDDVTNRKDVAMNEFIMANEEMQIRPLITLVGEDANTECKGCLAFSLFQYREKTLLMKIVTVNQTTYEIILSDGKIIFDRLKRNGKL